MLISVLQKLSTVYGKAIITENTLMLPEQRVFFSLTKEEITQLEMAEHPRDVRKVVDPRIVEEQPQPYQGQFDEQV